MRETDEKYRKLIESYLPGWQYDPDSGQPEAALLYAAWHLLEDTRHRMDCLPQKHKREFLNAWELTPQASQPMQTIAVLHAPEGERIRAGSELYLSGNGTRLWKTLGSTSAESMTLIKQVLESTELGKLKEISLPTKEIPSRLFDYRSPGDQHNRARFAHPDAFRTEDGERADLVFPECEGALLELLADRNRVHWFLERKDGTEAPLQQPELSGRKLIFTIPGEKNASALTAAFEPGSPVPTGTVGSVSVEVMRPMQACTEVLTDEEIVQSAAFEPFGPSPDLWRCGYLTAAVVLSLRGAEVQVDFLLSLDRREEKLPVPEQKPKYHAIMFHMPPPPPPAREVRADHVVWEYWNGTTWTPIPGTAGQSGLFAAGEELHRVSVRFQWPKDAAPCEVQGMNKLWIRWRITRGEGMGYLPRTVYVPRVHGVQMQSILNTEPVELAVKSGLNPNYVSLEQGRAARLFPYPVSTEDGWWLCFDRAPQAQDLNLYLEFAVRSIESEFSVWESTASGLKQCTVTDKTGGLSHSGMVSLEFLQGQLTEHFGCRGWWICVRNRENHLRRSGTYSRLTGLFCGSAMLEAEQEDICEVGETVKPLRGGAVSGKTLTQSFGGVSEETDSELLLRAERARHHLGRGVSALDVQQILQSEFRDVIRTRCRQNGTKMEIAVLMRDVHQHSAAFAQRQEQIHKLLEQKSVLPTTGLKICIREPNFYPVQASVWLQARPDSDIQTERELVEQALEHFLDPVTGKFRGDGWQIGDLPTEQELSNDLMMQLPQIHVLKVLLSVITPDGQEAECGQIRDPFALPVAGKTIVREVEGEEIK